MSHDQFFSSLWEKEIERFAQKRKVIAIHFGSFLDKRWCVVGNGPALILLLKFLNVASIKLVASWSFSFRNIFKKLILINVVLFIRLSLRGEKTGNVLGIWIFNSHLTFAISDG